MVMMMVTMMLDDDDHGDEGVILNLDSRPPSSEEIGHDEEIDGDGDERLTTDGMGLFKGVGWYRLLKVCVFEGCFFALGLVCVS